MLPTTSLWVSDVIANRRVPGMSVSKRGLLFAVMPAIKVCCHHNGGPVTKAHHYLQ